MGKKVLQTQTEPRLITDQTLRQNHRPRTKVINKINQLKKNRHLLCHLSNINKETDFGKSINHYNRFWKEYLITLALYQEAPATRRLRPSARGQRYVKLRYHQDRIGVSGNWEIKKIIEKVGRN
jgi:hypothetical protein